MMAAVHYYEDVQILGEMRQLFPKIPDVIIQNCVRQCQGDKQICCRLLALYESTDLNRHDTNVTGAYGNAEFHNEQEFRWQQLNSPNNSRSQSFSGACNANLHENVGKPQSAPINSGLPFMHYGSYSPIVPFRPSTRYPTPAVRHKSTLEIPPRYVSRVNMEVHQPKPRSPQLLVAVSTNGPAGSHYPHSPTSQAGPRVSPRPRASPTPRNEGDAFIDALLSYQEVRFQQLQRELMDSQETLQKLHREVATLEESLQNRSTFGGQIAGSGGDVLRSMRDEITKLRVECHCLSVEADICSKEQNQQGGDFYQNIFTGQVGPIPPVPPSSDNNGNQIDDIEGSRWKCTRCTFNNHPALNACEMCELPRKTIDC